MEDRGAETEIGNNNRSKLKQTFGDNELFVSNACEKIHLN